MLYGYVLLCNSWCNFALVNAVPVRISTEGTIRLPSIAESRLFLDFLHNELHANHIAGRLLHLTEAQARRLKTPLQD